MRNLSSLPALLAFATLVLACLPACSSEDAQGKGPGNLSGEPGDDAGPTETWEELITGDWHLDPGTEGYFCAKYTVEEEMYIQGFEAINPPGTHHTLLTMGEPSGPDGVEPCNAGTNRTLSVFGSGVGTDQLKFPEGVALKVEAGVQLLLNLHLFNTSDEEMSGVSGTRILQVAEPEVEQLAEGLLAGTVLLNIPPGDTTTHSGTCTLAEAATLFAVAPHMHQLGTYEKVVAESSLDGAVTIHDEPYSFDEQSYKLIDPVEMAAGDKIRIECTHQNTTTLQVGFGESSLAEMCFAGLYRYPATGKFFICSDDLPFGVMPQL